MNILITGIYGRLGYNLARFLSADGHCVCGTHHKTVAGSQEFPSVFLPLSQLEQMRLILQNDISVPDFIIHTAALTSVDGAQSEPELAMQVNGESLSVLSAYAERFDIPLVYISTDFVFDGKFGDYDENSETNPISVYGSSKLAGEKYVKGIKKHYILRMTPLGHRFRLPHHGRSIVEWLVEAARSGEEVTLFADKICSPVTSAEVYSLIASFLSGDLDYGLYHLGLQERFSLFDIGMQVRDFLHLPVSIRPLQHPDNAYSAIRPRICNLKSCKIPEYSISQILDSL